MTSTVDNVITANSAATPVQPAGVLIVDDAPRVLDAVRRFLAGQNFVTVVGTAGDGAAAVIQTADLQPDLVLMDLHMPELNGLEATAQIQRVYPDIRVVIMTVDDGREARRAVAACGAAGFVPKAHLHDRLLDELRRVLAAARKDPA